MNVQFLAATWTMLADAAGKSLLLLAAASVLVLLMRRSSASARHLIWATGLIGALALPAAGLVAPSWRVPVAVPNATLLDPTAHSASSGTIVAKGPFVFAGDLTNPADEHNVALLTATRPTAAVSAPAADTAWPTWLVALGIWASGVVALLLPLVAGSVSLRILRSRSLRVTDERLKRTLAEVQAELGVRRQVELLQSDRRTVPMTWGLWRAKLLLPSEAASWPAERLRIVLVHECAHIQRRDCLTQLCGQLARAIYWFDPLAWLAVARLRVEQEQACDDCVIASGAEAADYAEQLLSLTAKLQAVRLSSAVALAIGRADRIKSRLVAILDRTKNRRRLGQWTRRVVGFAALFIVAGLAGFTLERATAHEPVSDPIIEEAVQQPAEAPAETGDSVAKVRELIQQRYAKPVNAKTVNNGAIRGMLETLHDPYTEYLPAEKMDDLSRAITGGFSGIGVQIALKDKQLTVVTPFPDSPGFKAGIRPGDHILVIDGKSTQDMAIADAVKVLVGKAGTVVKVTVKHEDGGEAELAVTRAAIRLPTVVGLRREEDSSWNHWLDDRNKIGYVAMQQFSGNTPKEVASAVRALLAKGLRGLVVDLRQCPGGLLNAVMDTAKLFLSNGKIVSIKGNNMDEKSYIAADKAAFAELPLLVLVNEYTASAAEILAGALKDNGRAVMLGTRTYGKGSVQELIPLDGDKSAVKLTTGYFYRPNGRSIDKRAATDDKWGVDPDDGFFVPLDEKQNELRVKRSKEREIYGRKKKGDEPSSITFETLEKDFADPQLAAALKSMIARLETGEFHKVGKRAADAAAHATRREALRKQRDEALKALEKIDKELEELTKK